MVNQQFSSDGHGALEFVDRAIHAHTKKHLNDLERAVFTGSWEGKTYEEIYPLNPEYVEKYVSYKLWQKLSAVLGEKVTKKQLRGAVERAMHQKNSRESTQESVRESTQENNQARSPMLDLPPSPLELSAGLSEGLSSVAIPTTNQLHQYCAVTNYSQPDHSQPRQDRLDQDRQPATPLPQGCITSRQYGLLPANDPLSPPLPVADLDLPQGQVRLDSAFYVDRLPYEQQCYREIGQPGALIRIKAPRQMGKTSLMSRILQQARQNGYHTVPLSFQHADRSIFDNLDHLLQWFCTRITRKLRLSHAIDHHWTDTYGSKDNCTAYFEDFLLTAIDSPLVLGLDEVDRVFQYPKIADDFFGLLRAWHEEAGYGGSNSHLWEKLRLVVVHSTEVYIPLDMNQSPFNVGLPIELSEFTPEQVIDLARRHGMDWQRVDCDRLMQIVGGHPYLVRLALYHLCQQQLTLAELANTAPTEAGIYSDHLRRHLWNLQQHPELAQGFSQAVASDHPVELDSILAFKLHSLGLVQLQGNEVTPRLALYNTYFRDRLASLSSLRSGL